MQVAESNTTAPKGHSGTGLTKAQAVRWSTERSQQMHSAAGEFVLVNDINLSGDL